MARWFELWLYGPEGTQVSCLVYWRIRNDKRETWFEKDWKKFVEINGFVKDDVLMMCFVNEVTSTVVKVAKI